MARGCCDLLGSSSPILEEQTHVLHPHVLHRSQVPRSGTGGGMVTTITTATPTEAGWLSASAGGVDRVIRISTAIAVLAVAGVAAYESYWHAYAVIRVHGESGVTARLEPAIIDGLVYASSTVIMYATRHGLPVARLVL